MRVLFVGGTGVISSACSRLAVERGVDLTLLSRGQSGRPAPDGARVLRADIRDAASVRAALGSRTFDAVVDWVAFSPEHVEADLDLFRGRTGQYVLIGSASAYQTPPAALPITEETPLNNPFWAYSRAKIASEDRLFRAFHDEGFPATVVRPSHTYDETALPMHGGYTAVDRMRRGLPVVVHGDGTSVWTLTHSRDFARGLVGLLGHAEAVGEAFHVTSDEWLTWDQIHGAVARAAGVEAPRLVHVPSETIAAFDARWGESLLGDKAHSMMFDNAKVRRLVPDVSPAIPFARGAEEIIAWHDADPTRRRVDHAVDRLMDRLVAAMDALRP